MDAGDYLAIPYPGGGEVYSIKRAMFDGIFARQTKGTYIPPQAEVLAHWEGVLRSSGTVFTRTAAVNAKVAVEDGILGPERAVSNVLI